jgi:hypothetical protein
MSVGRVVKGIILVAVVSTLAGKVGSTTGLITAVALVASGILLILWSNRREAHRSSTKE